LQSEYHEPAGDGELLAGRHDSEAYPVEIKSGETVVSEMTAGLRWWCRQAGLDTERATLVYAGRDHQRRHGIDVRPWFAI